jgi:prepilin-type N-terminal cleavage/methylation domain-containing protein
MMNLFIRSSRIADDLRVVGGTRSTASSLKAFTLLEVILAIAILGVSMAWIGEVVSRSFNNAASAADSLESRIVAQSVLDQLKCGALEITNAGPMQMSSAEALGDWMVQIIVEPTTVQELVQVRVLVGTTLEPGERPACELVRWYQNPEFAEAAAAEAANAAAAASDAAAASSSSSSSSSSQ